MLDTGIVDSAALVESLQREIEEDEYLFSNNAEEVAVGLSTRPCLGERAPPARTYGEERGEGTVVRGTRVVRIDPGGSGGWVVQMESGWEGLADGEKGEVESVECGMVINAAGLGAVSLGEQVSSDRQKVGLWAVKGGSLVERFGPC